MVKKGWENRKNKAGFFYYLLMIIFAFTMLLIAFGLLNTQDIQDWWNGTIW